MNDHLLPHHRRPVVIADSKLRAGGAAARLDGDDPEALLRQYLRLIRRVRNQQRDRSIALRRVDIAALAEHLGWTDEDVLSRLAALMGATQRQRSAMLAILASGVSLITIAGPLDVAVASNETIGATPTDIPVVVVSEQLASDGPPSAGHTARLVLSDEATPRPSSAPLDRSGRHAPVLEAQQRRGDVVASMRIDRPDPTASDALSTQGVEPESTVEQPSAPQSEAVTDTPQVAPSPSPESDDGVIVAVGEPPVPPATDANDNSVAVGEPTVPPDANDNSVAVGEPPVPPATDANDNSVAVGEPPVPPAPPAPPVPTDEA